MILVILHHLLNVSVQLANKRGLKKYISAVLKLVKCSYAFLCWLKHLTRTANCNEMYMILGVSVDTLR
jgi:hypothetical protein